MFEKLKPLLASDTIFTALLLILIGIVSFGLGRQSAFESGAGPAPTAPAGVIFTEAPTAARLPDQTNSSAPNQTIAAPVNTAQYVASKSGTKYHRLDCPGATQIKEENKIFFNSIELAQAAGFQPAANCPNLQ